MAATLGQAEQISRIDRAEFFLEKIAQSKINLAQALFLYRLSAALDG